MKKKKYNRNIQWILIGTGLSIFMFFLCLGILFCMIFYKTVNDNCISDSMGLIDKTITKQQNSSTENTHKINETEMSESILNEIQDFAKKNHIAMNEYTEKIIALLEKNLETKEFVLNYPLKKGTYSNEPLYEYLNQEEMPLLMQWDSRWGYYSYGSDVLGITGCGPTCLSMVAIHLLQNPNFTPIYIADYAQSNGYYVQGVGTSWDFMKKGALSLGLCAREVPLNENTIKQHLQNRNPIICIMGRGDFTDNGHFVVFVSMKDDKIKINDPNSRENSEKLWEFEDIKYQIKNMWVYS